MQQYIRTEVLQVHPEHPDPAIISRAADLLRRGEVVVFPTETVYGLGADAFQPAALERIFAAKGRPFSDPLIVHIADLADLARLASTLPALTQRLTRAFWPGPLTLIVPRNPGVPSLVTAGLETVAIRMPRHAVALALIRALGSPIAAPSANRFMHVSPTTAQHALADLQGRVPLILDGGPCEVGIESTVLDLCAEPPIILRPGGTSLEMLRSILPDVQPLRQRQPLSAPAHQLTIEEEPPQMSPGQLMTHYAPSVPLMLYDGSAEAMRAAIVAELHRQQEHGMTVGILIADEDVPAFQDSGAVVRSLGSLAHPDQLANALFAGLRVLEDAGVQVILCRSFDSAGLGLAIRDRLLKAAGGKVIVV